MQETWEMQVQSLGWENSLEEGMAAHSSILAWRISWTEEPGGLQSMGLQRVRQDWAVNTSSSPYPITGERRSTLSLSIAGRWQNQDLNPHHLFMESMAWMNLLFYCWMLQSDVCNFQLTSSEKDTCFLLLCPFSGRWMWRWANFNQVNEDIISASFWLTFARYIN